MGSPSLRFRECSSACRSGAGPHKAAGGASARRPHSVAAAAQPGDDDIQIGAELLAGRADAAAGMKWREATVVENRCAVPPL